MSPETRFIRFDGLTVFAAIALVAGLAGVAALERIGAPEGLVKAGGPIVALFAVGVFGFGSRNVDLSSFVSAGRRLKPIYGGLGATAIAAGLLSCLDGRAASDPPLPALAAGLAFGALLFAPLIRRFGATSPADIVATCFPRSLARIVSAAAIFAAGALTAFAGFSLAVETLLSAGVPNRLLAEIVGAAVLICGALPGLPGVAASAAASGAALVGLAAVVYAAGWQDSGPPAEPAGFSTRLDLGSPDALASVVATVLASASLSVFAPPSAASPNAGAAFKAGLAAVALCLALAAAGVVGIVSPSSGRIATSPVAASLFGAATISSALSLALVGVYASSRALGLALADAWQRLGPIPSVRLARMRAVELIVIAGCVVSNAHDVLGARSALAVAMALMLAFPAPLLALAAIPRAGPASASDAMLAALAVAAFRLAPSTGAPSPAEMFETALLSAAAAFAAGCLSCLFRPRPATVPRPLAEPEP